MNFWKNSHMHTFQLFFPFIQEAERQTDTHMETERLCPLVYSPNASQQRLGAGHPTPEPPLLPPRQESGAELDIPIRHVVIPTARPNTGPSKMFCTKVNLSFNFSWTFWNILCSQKGDFHLFPKLKEEKFFKYSILSDQNCNNIELSFLNRSVPQKRKLLSDSQCWFRAKSGNFNFRWIFWLVNWGSISQKFQRCFHQVLRLKKRRGRTSDLHWLNENVAASLLRSQPRHGWRLSIHEH